LDYPGEPVDSSALMGLEILLVDDALEALEACRTLLELEGAHVQAEARAKQALAAATSDDFDLILSDNGMPERQSRHWACFLSASDEAEKLLNAMPTHSAEQRFALLDHQDKTRFFRG
jgi:CheY-like chemotaxis protein